MNEPRKQLQAFSLAADQHAREQHGKEISVTDVESVAVVDAILDQERSEDDPNLVQSLTLCYGAWLGEYMNHHHDGQWVGLSEPTPPRVSLRGVVYSPLDAVQRRLADPSSPTLPSLVRQLGPTESRSTDDEVSANRRAWDDKANDPRFVHTGHLAETREEASAAVDPWLRAEGPLDECRLLCLAAGGGTHGPLHAMAGAKVTVVDFSASQLHRDEQMAQHYGLSLDLIHASMHHLPTLARDAFDAILHPVSLCYVRDIPAVYAEVSRLLRPGGVYISQQKQPATLQASSFRPELGYLLATPCDEATELSASEDETAFRESGTTEFIHSLDTLLGTMCRSGMVIEDIAEPPRGDAWAPPNTAEHRARFLPPYLKIKARRA